VTRLTTCPDAEAVAVRAAADIRRQLELARRERGEAHLALSGGSTPARTYELLAGCGSDWDGIEVWFADERCVPPDHADSNYRMARDTLLGEGAVPAERVHRMLGELGPAEGSARYAQELAARLCNGEVDRPVRPPDQAPAVPVLDVIVLGIGPDGHVASLFPGASTLEAGRDAVALAVVDSPKPPPERITLSLEVLRSARSCVLLATGPGKADAVQAMLGEPTGHVPASLLRRERLTVIVDDAAAPLPPRA
jgi:6-phosphogluconolactonase